jgi:hypothetical protein
MIPVSTGLAKFSIDATGEIFTVSPVELDWQQDGGDDRQMGPELRYVAVFELTSKTDGRSYEAEWELYEYPIGCQNQENFRVSNGITVLENLKNHLEHERE